MQWFERSNALALSPANSKVCMPLTLLNEKLDLRFYPSFMGLLDCAFFLGSFPKRRCNFLFLFASICSSPPSSSLHYLVLFRVLEQLDRASRQLRDHGWGTSRQFAHPG